MPKNIFKQLYRILVVFGLLVLLVRGANWMLRHGQPLPAPPQPNAYPALISAARSLTPPPTDLAELTSTQIRNLARQNRPAIERARAGLELQSGVTVEATKRWDDSHEEELKALKQLAVAFGVEARVQLMDGQTNAAARCYLDMIRLAQDMSNGGIMLDGITSLAVETIGTGTLQSMVPRLDAEFCQSAAQTLETLDARRETPAAVIATEKAWSARRFGLINLMGGLFMSHDLAQRRAKFVTRTNEAHDRTQRLMLRLAAHAYELAQPQPAAKVSDLIPVYLKVIPREWTTGAEVQALPGPVQ